MPVDWLLSDEYAAELAASIDMQRATPSADVSPGTPPAPESPDTTRASVVRLPLAEEMTSHDAYQSLASVAVMNGIVAEYNAMLRRQNIAPIISQQDGGGPQ